MLFRSSYTRDSAVGSGIPVCLENVGISFDGQRAVGTAFSGQRSWLATAETLAGNPSNIAATTTWNERIETYPWSTMSTQPPSALVGHWCVVDGGGRGREEVSHRDTRFNHSQTGRVVFHERCAVFPESKHKCVGSCEISRNVSVFVRCVGFARCVAVSAFLYPPFSLWAHGCMIVHVRGASLPRFR